MMTLPTTNNAMAADQKSGLPYAVKAAIVIVGIFGTFSYFAILQEDVYKKKYNGEKFTYTLFVLLLERSMNSLVAYIGMLLSAKSKYKVPIKEISISGTTQMIAMGASNEALRYVSYPTQVLGKSCKMVPVFIAGILLAGKAAEYVMADYLQVAVVTLGVCVFNFGGKAKAGADDSTYGLALIMMSLACDGATGGLQDKVKKTCKAINHDDDAKITMFESMFYTNASGALVALVLATFTGQLTAGASMLMGSGALTMAVFMFAALSALGQCFVFYTINEFGPLWLTTLTTTRKIFSTVYSVFRSPDNSLATMQWIGVGLVFGGIIMAEARKVLTGPKKSNGKGK